MYGCATFRCAFLVLASSITPLELKTTLTRVVRRGLLAALFLWAILFPPVIANALTTYTYTGNVFDTIADETPPGGSYDNTMFVSGSFSLATPLVMDFLFGNITPLAFSFTDGRNTLTNFNSTIVEFLVGTDSSGNIDEWGINVFVDFPSIVVGQQAKSISTSTILSSDKGEISEIFNVDSVGSFAASSDSAENAVPGSWIRTTIAAVPEPSSLLLFTSGLLGLPIVRRKFRR